MPAARLPPLPFASTSAIAVAVDAELLANSNVSSAIAELRGEEQVVEQLRHLAAAERRRGAARGAVGREDRPDPFHDGVVTADHHQQLAFRGRDAAATHRRVDDVDPTLAGLVRRADGTCPDGRSRGSR